MERLMRRYVLPGLSYTLLTVVAFLMVFPFLWMASTSLKNIGEAKMRVLEQVSGLQVDLERIITVEQFEIK